MIQVEHLTKWYGSNQAVKDLSFEIGDKGVYGFLGPNGAGKSTTLNMLTGCLSPTEGKITVGGFDILEEPKKAKKRIGYLPEQPPVYMQESPWEYLHFVGEAKGLRGEELEAQVSDALAKTGTEDVKHKRIGALSKGYRQRVGIAQALLGDPQVVILDEPTVGLDPIQILDIRNLIRELGRDRCVIFSSHILSEVQTVCDSVLMIARGRLVAFDTPENLEKQLRSAQQIRLTARAGEEKLREIAETVAGSSVLSASADADGYTSLTLSGSGGYGLTEKLFGAFAQANVPLAELRIARADLEDVFLELAETPEQAPEKTAEKEEEA
mgnify:FL=1